MTKLMWIVLSMTSAAVVVGGVTIAALNGAFDKPESKPASIVSSTDAPAKPVGETKSADVPTIEKPPLDGTVTRDTPPVAEGQETEVASLPPGVAPAMSGMGADLHFDIVRVEPNGDAVIAGRAAPNSKVAIRVSGELVAITDADAAGEWVVVLDRPLPAGTSDIAIVSMSADERPIAESAERVAVVIPEGGNGEVLIVKQAPDTVTEVIAKPETEVAALDTKTMPVEAESTKSETPAEPTAAETAATPPAEPAAPEQVASRSVTPPAAEQPVPVVVADPEIGIEIVEVEGDRIRLSGTANPGATARVYVDNLHIGDAGAGDSGRWSLSVRAAVGVGQHTVRVDNIRVDDGAVVARAEVPFVKEYDEVAIGKVKIVARGEAQVAELGEASGATDAKSVEIKRGDNLWRIARELWGHGIRYTSIYDANRGQIRNPNLIFPGQIFLIPKVAKAADDTATSTQ
ncbi:MAG: LysM peptidoglycan-binding domain-containing protein [Hyphomicrobiales bacterium]|nr:LysM peptidoglycan-binding domain-containing protein [Hyphomicrobiales bacterium]